MSDKPTNDTHDPFPAPPCYAPVGEVARAKSHGAWSMLLKITTALFALSIPFGVAWAVWVTQKISSIEQTAAVLRTITDQIRSTAGTVAQHEREITSLTAGVGTVARDLMPMPDRIRMFVTRSEWEFGGKAVEREFETVKLSLREANIKLDRLLDSKRGVNDQ